MEDIKKLDLLIYYFKEKNLTPFKTLNLIKASFLLPENWRISKSYLPGVLGFNLTFIYLTLVKKIEQRLCRQHQDDDNKTAHPIEIINIQIIILLTE